MNKWKLPTKNYQIGSWLGIIFGTIATLTVFGIIFKLLYYAVKNESDFTVIGAYFCLFLLSALFSILTAVLSFNVYTNKINSQHIVAILIIIFNCISLAFWLSYCLLSLHAVVNTFSLGQIFSLVMVGLTIFELIAGIIMAIVYNN